VLEIELFKDDELGQSRAGDGIDDWLTLQLKMRLGNKNEQHGTLSVG
jgi:hypothetical protein